MSQLLILTQWLTLHLPRRIRDSERGASLIEYAMLASFIAIFALVAVKFFGGKVSSNFSNSANEMP